jgi:hypothetical protein
VSSDPKVQEADDAKEDNNESVEKLRDRFFKQRSLLLGVSVVLMAHLLLGLKIGKSAESSGFKFEIADPNTLWLGAWAVWVWALISYLQIFNSMRAMQFYPRDRMEEVYGYLVDRALIKYIWKLAKRRYRSIPWRSRRGLSVQRLPRIQDSLPRLVGNRAHSVAIFTTKWKRTANAPTIDSFRALRDFDKKGGSGWSTAGGTKAQELNQFEVSEEVRVRVCDFRGRKFIAYLWTALSTSFGLDYLAPLAIALVPPIVWLWQSSSVSVIRHHFGLP